jgi:hypothetical protein
MLSDHPSKDIGRTRHPIVSWDEFADVLANELQRGDLLERTDLLLADVGCDSFDLLIVAAVLWDLGEVDFPEHADLLGLTVGDVFDWYCVETATKER